MKKVLLLAASGIGALFLTGCASGQGPSDRDELSARSEGLGLKIRTISTRADLVTGGDARIAVEAGEGAEFGRLQLLVNEEPREGVLAVEGSTAQGVVRGLRIGMNSIRVISDQAGEGALEIVNHPLGGPLLSGQQVQPWICATPTPQSETATEAATFASGLTARALDSQCNVVSEVNFYYRTTTSNCDEVHGKSNSCFQPYEMGGLRPDDMAVITTAAGYQMDYIVRVERGSINRGLYDIAVLHDPIGRADELHAWNGKLVYFLGGSTGNLRRQVEPASTWALDEPLSRGFMVAVNSHTDASRNANRVVSAETVLMMKEYISDTYGQVLYAIGYGCSAGSMQLNVIASMYPGIIDGSVIACSYPDSDGHGQEIFDSYLLRNFFSGPVFAALMSGKGADAVNQARADIAGHKDTRSVDHFGRFMHATKPGVYGDEPMSNGCRLPNRMVYDAVTNPSGIRCSTADHNVAIWGVVEGTELPRNVRDNEGLQYGLGALLSGKISSEEFVVLNEHIGGMDADGNFVPRRNVADLGALETAYRSGLISDGHALAGTPIIDLRGDENSSVHYNWSAFALRDRLMKANGNLDNHVIWRVGLPGGGAPWVNKEWIDSGLTGMGLDVMDRWLSNIKADASMSSRPDKVRRGRPDDAVDFCYIGTDYGARVTDVEVCDADPATRIYSSIRQIAGGPRSTDVLKCSLRPIDRADYQGRISDEQFRRLAAVFSTGVCDWSKPGVGQQRSQPWTTFSYGPGGKPLPLLP